ncbi:hypothetical protein [[Eubacterium] hominis]|uniref:hypothetical protein n=1 Tax=[Eubacterium] hominis TaxID=2764325 RepID=UPI003A4D9EDB
MFKKNINYVTMFATGAFFCVLGFSFIFDSLTVWNWLYTTFVIGVAAVGIIRLFNLIINFRKVDNRLNQLIDIIIWIIAISISLSYPSTFFSLLPRLVGAWILLHAIVKVIVLWIKQHDHLPIPIHSIVYLIGDLIMSFFLISSPFMHEELISFCMGCYFLIYGGNSLLDLVREIIPSGSAEKLDNKIRLSVPPFMSVIIPPHLMRTLLNKDKEDQLKEQFEAIKEDIPIDMEVLIHLAPSGPAMLGHADMIYRGLVLSYGCYDPHERHLFGTMGDGVVIIAPKDTYIHNCLANENKILISFGIALNETQKDKLNKRLLEVFSTFEDFHSDEELKQMGESFEGACDDYLSRVTRTSPKSKFYKIKEGKLKTFFVVSSNCVFFLSNILKVIGLHLVDLSGIISPGAYYDFLNNQFKSNKGFVVSRKLYRKKDAVYFETAQRKNG